MHPAPQITCRPATDAETPRTAAALAAKAVEAGWDVAVTYSRGVSIDGEGRPVAEVRRVPLADPNTGAPLLSPTGRQRHEEVPTGEHKVVDSLVVRLRRGRARAAACWVDGRFDVGLVFSPDARTLTSRHLGSFVTSAP